MKKIKIIIDFTKVKGRNVPECLIWNKNRNGNQALAESAEISTSSSAHIRQLLNRFYRQHERKGIAHWTCLGKGCRRHYKLIKKGSDWVFLSGPRGNHTNKCNKLPTDK